MRLSPLLHVTERTAGEGAPEHRSIPNAHGDFMLAIGGMEVRRIVIVEEHADDDTEKPADLRHRPLYVTPVPWWDPPNTETSRAGAAMTLPYEIGCSAQSGWWRK